MQVPRTHKILFERVAAIWERRLDELLGEIAVTRNERNQRALEDSVAECIYHLDALQMMVAA